jgi:hypothetical protein
MQEQHSRMLKLAATLDTFTLTMVEAGPDSPEKDLALTRVLVPQAEFKARQILLEAKAARQKVKKSTPKWVTYALEEIIAISISVANLAVSTKREMAQNNWHMVGHNISAMSGSGLRMIKLLWYGPEPNGKD